MAQDSAPAFAAQRAVAKGGQHSSLQNDSNSLLMATELVAEVLHQGWRANGGPGRAAGARPKPPTTLTMKASGCFECSCGALPRGC
eukprot:2512753-Alexandrium_andersonii.AAC.1